MFFLVFDVVKFVVLTFSQIKDSRWGKFITFFNHSKENCEVTAKVSI
jgi:hypothetical protein